MKRAFQTVGLVGAIAVGSLLVGIDSVQAGGCGGGGGTSRGGYGGGHFFSRATYAPAGCGSNCNMRGMAMGGMSMATAQAPAASMQGMNMGAPAPTAAPAAPMQGMDMGATVPAPAAAPMQGMNLGAVAQPSGVVAASYTCPMHPNVVSAGPATCPYCRMALKRK